MGLLGLYMGNVARVRKKLVGCAVFLKLVCPLFFSDPACAENCVGDPYERKPGHFGKVKSPLFS